MTESSVTVKETVVQDMETRGEKSKVTEDVVMEKPVVTMDEEVTEKPVVTMDDKVTEEQVVTMGEEVTEVTVMMRVL